MSEVSEIRWCKESLCVNSFYFHDLRKQQSVRAKDSE